MERKNIFTNETGEEFISKTAMRHWLYIHLESEIDLLNDHYVKYFKDESNCSHFGFMFKHFNRIDCLVSISDSYSVINRTEYNYLLDSINFIKEVLATPDKPEDICGLIPDITFLRK